MQGCPAQTFLPPCGYLQAVLSIGGFYGLVLGVDEFPFEVMPDSKM